MPFKSEAQRRFMYAQHPAIAKRWSAKTPKGKKLPERRTKIGAGVVHFKTASPLTAELLTGLTPERIQKELRKAQPAWLRARTRVRDRLNE